VWWERRKIDMKHFEKLNGFSFSNCFTNLYRRYNMTSKTLPGWTSAYTHYHLLEWGLLVDTINSENAKFELGDADLILNKRFLQCWAGLSLLVFMITIKSRYETVLKDWTQFLFLKNLISYFQDPCKVFKICKTKFLPRFQSTDSTTCDTSKFSKLVSTYQLLEILFSHKLIFNVHK
jgi:hypothetical protein